jgi:hypothetical protein
MHCELEAIVCSGPLAGKKHTYALVDERVPPGDGFDRDDALIELARRYLSSHGPATVTDFRWWSSLTTADIRQALEGLGRKVRRETIDGSTFWTLTKDADPPARVRGAHLLQGYDELIVGYTESRFFGDPVGARARETWRDRSLPTGVILLDGKVAGHWKRTVVKDTVKVEMLTYEEAEPRELRALESVGTRLAQFLDRRPRIEIGRL